MTAAWARLDVCRPSGSLALMQGNPQPGDVYEAQTIIFLSDDRKPRRRVALLWRAPGMPAWNAAGRSTTDCRPQDLPSVEGDSPGFSRDGCFSSRFYHSFLASHCDTPRCEFKGSMTDSAFEDLRSAASAW